MVTFSDNVLTLRSVSRCSLLTKRTGVFPTNRQNAPLCCATHSLHAPYCCHAGKGTNLPAGGKILKGPECMKAYNCREMTCSTTIFQYYKGDRSHVRAWVVGDTGGPGDRAQEVSHSHFLVSTNIQVCTSPACVPLFTMICK